jgi:hypothetical protein
MGTGKGGGGGGGFGGISCGTCGNSIAVRAQREGPGGQLAVGWVIGLERARETERERESESER